MPLDGNLVLMRVGQARFHGNVAASFEHAHLLLTQGDIMMMNAGLIVKIIVDIKRNNQLTVSQHCLTSSLNGLETTTRLSNWPIEASEKFL